MSRIEKIGRLHKFIKQNIHFTPFELAQRLGISTSSLYNYLDELELYGAEIGYDKVTKTFYYKNNFEFKLVIKNEGQTLIIGGNHYFDEIPFFWKNSL